MNRKMFIAYLAVCGLACITAYPADKIQSVSVTQDTHGNFKVHVDIDGVQKIEEGKADGSRIGSYSYVDKDGQLHRVEYTAGIEGFKAIGTHLPVAPVETKVPVPETPEVIRARQQHFEEVQKLQI